MENLKAFALRHPFLLFISVFVVSRLLGLGLTGAVRLARPELSVPEDLGWLLQLGYAGGAVLAVAMLGLRRVSGLVRPKSPRDWLLWLPSLAIPAYILLRLGAQPLGAGSLAAMLLAALFVAVNEELLFRGLLLRGFLRYGERAAIWLPAALFGALHLGNIGAGADPAFTLCQAAWTFAIGIAYGAMRLRGRSLYPLIAAHWLVDATEYLATGQTGIHPEAFGFSVLAGFTLLVALFAVYSYWLYLRSNADAA